MRNRHSRYEFGPDISALHLASNTPGAGCSLACRRIIAVTLLLRLVDPRSAAHFTIIDYKKKCSSWRRISVILSTLDTLAILKSAEDHRSGLGRNFPFNLDFN